MNILVFISGNKRTIPVDIPLRELKKNGHKIFLLTIAESKGTLHKIYEEFGAITTNFFVKRVNSVVDIVRYIIYLRRFCSENKIDVVFSHLQKANLIAVLSSFIFRLPVVPFRHHCKFHRLVPECKLRPHPREVLADKLINRLASLIVVPGTAVRKAMVQSEKVKAGKIVIIPYAYDFNEMEKIDREAVSQIRNRFNHEVLLIIVSRLTPFKRHELAIETLSNLRSRGIDAGLIIMDEGPELLSIKSLTMAKGLSNCVYFCGFKQNVLEYIAAADILLNPSITDASNSVVKEAGLMQKVVITCKDVGDCDDYIVQGENGYLVQASSFATEAAEIIEKLKSNSKVRLEIGKKLRTAVVSKFALSRQLIDQYAGLLNVSHS